ncbi:MAG: PAS domain S-box protein [Nitrospinae bacterium]|nr:PAS domain S-box protein [Nitrospinota bacterium]
MNGAEDLYSQLEELRKERDTYAKALADSNAAFREKVNEFSIIKRIGDSIRWNLDKRRVCVEIVDIIIDETMAENCSLWVVDPERRFIQLTAVRGQRDHEVRYFDPGDPRASSMPLGEGVAGWVAKHGTSLLIKDVSESARFLEMGGTAVSSSIKSLLCLPIKGKDDVVGVVNMSHPDIGAFSKDNERVLNLITNQAALAFANILLFEQIQRFNEQLERTVEERTRNLSLSERKYRSFMENAGDAILVVDMAEGKIIESNSRTCDYTGYPKEELTGKDLNFLLGPGLTERLNTALLGAAGRLEGVPMKNRAGAELYCDITANVISTQAGEVIHLIIRDITHRLKLEAKLKEYNESLEEMVKKRTMELAHAQDELLQASKMAAIGELASGVAHEINNPIAIISGYAEDLMDKLKLSGVARVGQDTVMGVLAMITSQAERCLDITRSLLNFARKQEIFVSVVDINQAALATQGLAKHKTEDKHVALVNNLGGNLPPIRTDLNMVEQVLLNIYNNGVDAIEDRGEIITTTSFDGENFHLVIEDTGSGIPPENLDKIFNPFFTTKPVGRGTGLGLAICQQLVDRLKGKISVESEPGKGASFHVILPLEIHSNNEHWKG